MRLFSTLLFVLVVAFCNKVQAQDFETATQAVQNMGLGWNLGNTLDANNQSVTNITSASYWGQKDWSRRTAGDSPQQSPN